MVKIRDIVGYLEHVAPLAYQEDYDNAGLIIGDPSVPVEGVLTCLDITELVLNEAKERNCNLIIAHHPIIFRPMTSLNGRNHTERCIIYAIKQQIAIYTLHTNLDNVSWGVNRKMAQVLGLHNLSVLLPKPGTLSQLTTFVPQSATDHVLRALYKAGAGYIGDYIYDHVATSAAGFKKPTAMAMTHPVVDKKLEKVEESKVEVVFPVHLESSVLRALQAAHPCREAVYYVHALKNTDVGVGSGMVGELFQSISSQAFLEYLKAKMQLTCVRHTAPIARPIKRVAVCGGSGSFLVHAALLKQVDALVTSDMRYHDFFKAEDQILLVDVGHYESEVGTKALIRTLLSEKFVNIAVLECSTVTNPVHYF
ncbi:MAG: Nif3-like dinuclear metal center hexameric protein [Amoebophilaceae bacterium]|nr:Nif3-like dinuclear metal center hexameric protein [Amoebophilaceae bacterium]